MIARPVGAMVTVRLTDLFCAEVPESVAWKVSGVPFTGAVGVPVIAPLEAFSARPTGSVPLVSAHLYGVVPPVAINVAV